MEIAPLGDSSLIIRVCENFDTAPSEALKAVLATQRCLEAAQIPGVIELAPAYTTVAVFFDPLHLVAAGAPVESIYEWLARRISDALKLVIEADKPGRSKHHFSKVIEIPVCYEPEFAFDLDDVARHAGIEQKDVIDLHCNAEYRVHCVGFTPGFPFLGGLPRKLATPRRATPRKEIPAGSVAIGGVQTGIYPVKSPGGWNVIGRTPLLLFEPRKDPPSFLRAGDGVRFRAITRAEFERLAR